MSLLGHAVEHAQRLALGILGFAGAVAIWYLTVARRWVNPILLPGPGTVAPHLWQGWTEPSFTGSPLAKASVQTLRHFAIGFGLATLLGVALGAIVGMLRQVRLYASGVLRFLQYVPPAAILPLLILYLYVGERTIAAFVVFASVWPVFIHTEDAFEHRDPVLDAASRSFGWRGVRLAARTVLPAVVPEISVGIRVASAIALISTVLGEFVAGDNDTGGLGFAIISAKQSYRYPDMYPAVISLALIGFSVNILFMSLERGASRWRHSGAGPR